jgi:N-acetylglutamate synthase-like GNAT family acetyltransferase
VVGCGMELTQPATVAATTQLQVSTGEATWSDVVAEITSSCGRRASGDALFQVPGAVGVLAGPAPVVWVHGGVDTDRLLDALGSAPDVDEVYVTTEQPGIAALLEQAGWTTTEVVAQLTHELGPVNNLVAGMPSVDFLHPGDMADVRRLLRTFGGVEESQLDCSYGDDFFVVAAPVWLLGARDGAGRLVGLVGMRRQGRSAMGFALTVDADWRSTGLSTALVAAAVRHASAIGVEFVHAQASTRSVRRLVGCGFNAVGAWQRLVRG